MKTKIFVGKLYEVAGWYLPIWAIGRAGYDTPDKLFTGELFVVLSIAPFNTVILCKDGFFACYENHIIETAQRMC